MENKTHPKQPHSGESALSLTGNLSLLDASDAPLKPLKGKSLPGNMCPVNDGQWGYNESTRAQIKKRGTSEAGWEKLKDTELLEYQPMPITPLTVYGNVRDMDFELAGVWDRGPCRHCAKNADTITEDSTEQLHPVENSIALKGNAKSALDQFLHDTGPWSAINVRARASISNPRDESQSLPVRHVM